MAPIDAPVSVFISYSHDSAEHSARVRALAERLRGDGFHCVLDQDEPSPPENWPRWAARQIREADFVLVVCTEEYYSRAVGRVEPGIGRGVRWEGLLIYQEIYNADSMNTRFVPVLLADAAFASIPEPLQGATFFRTEEEGDYRALVQRLRKQALPSLPQIRGPSRKLWLVPLARNPFFSGRDAVLADLHARFTSSNEAGVQALSGLGGVGKSQVAAEYAHRYRERYDAVFWVPASSEASLELGFSRIAEKVGRASPGGQGALIDVVNHWFQSNDRWLLVLDNVDSAELVARFLPATFAGNILLTSRLDVLDAAFVKSPIFLPELTNSEAIRFLQARTQRELLAGAELEAATQLVQELGSLPLALEQAGAYMLKTRAAFVDYLDGYHKTRMQLLEKRGPVQGSYPHSIATTWQMNLEQLDESAASADLLRLSALLHPDNIPIDLLTRGRSELGPALEKALVDTSNLAVNEVLEPLSRYSLIRRDVGARTYSMHRLLQDVVRGTMTEDERQASTVRMVRALERVFPSPDALYAEWRDCDALIPHVQACLAHVHLAPLAGVDLMIHAGFYLTQRAQYAVAEPLLRTAMRAAETLGEGERLRLAHAMDRLGWLHYRRERFDEAEPLYLRARTLREQVLGRENIETCHITGHLAVLYDRLSRWDEAEASYQEILQIGRNTLQPDDHAIAIWLGNMAVLYEHQARYAEAVQCGERAREIFEIRLPRTHPLLAKSIENMGWVRLRMGDFATAESLFRESLQLREQVFGAASPEVARSWVNLAGVFVESGTGDAEAALSRALRIREAALPASHPDVAASLSELGELYVGRERLADAEPLYERALATYELAFGREHAIVAAMLDRYAVLLDRLGRESSAGQAKARAEAIRRIRE